MLSVGGWLSSWLSIGSSQTQRGSVYISGGAVAVAKCEPTEAGLQVDLRTDPIESLPLAREILRTQSRGIGLEDMACGLVLAPELYALTLIERPPVADDELNEAVRWQIQENVDFDVAEATLDTFDLPKSAQRDRPMVFVAAMRKDVLKGLLDMVYAAGITVDSVSVTELALRNIVSSLFPEADLGVGLLRITSTGGIISVSRGEELFLSRRISGVPVEFEQSTWDDFRERLLLQVQRSIDYYESALSQPPCSGLVVASTHDWQGHVCEGLRDMLPFTVRPIEDELRALFHITLHNPDPVDLDWSNLSVAQQNAITHALPALGALLTLTGRVEQGMAGVAT